MTEEKDPVHRLTERLRAVDATTEGSLYEALEICQLLRATPHFSVEAVDERDLPATAEASTAAHDAVCLRLEARRGDHAVEDWAWRIEASAWDAYRAAIELGVAGTVAAVRRRLENADGAMDRFEHEPAVAANVGDASASGRKAQVGPGSEGPTGIAALTAEEATEHDYDMDAHLSCVLLEQLLRERDDD